MVNKLPEIELIGSVIEVIKSRNPALIGIKGKVIDETKNILMLETQKGIKKLIKSQITLKLGANIIKGDHIIRRPEEIR